jgi:single-strand DNA-binding protein
VTCWRKLAESVLASLGKGDPVIVTGQECRAVTTRKANPRSLPELEASAVGPNLNRC